jgi:hypothetical protein
MSSSNRLLAELLSEQEEVDALLATLRSQGFRCYVCQERMNLSMLVLNDRCRHSVCRVCFAKVTMDGERGDCPTLYRCLMCQTLSAPQSIYCPSTLAILSPGFAPVREYERLDVSSPIGYRVQLIDNLVASPRHA